MKRLFCICLIMILCLGVCGCQEMDDQPKALPSLGFWEMEAVETDEDYVYGEILNKLEPDVLELNCGSQRMVEEWGENVYIITDELDDWCVGDEIEVHFHKVYRPNDTKQYVRIVADKIEPLMLCYKPIIYFYPEVDTLCSAKLTLNGKLTCTYPEHGESGWENFVAQPDGTLIFPDGKEYYALYWEGEQVAAWDFSQGYCVPGENTAEFLEWALAAQGLTAREANEFIVYWLPVLQENPYNVISFQTDAYTDGTVLEITPAPDSLLRIFMAYYPSDVEIEIAPQSFDPFVREGFTVVEWGGGPA